MKAYSCCDCFDYSLSNNCLEHIYSGSEEARSAFISPPFHKINQAHKSEASSRNINRQLYIRAQSNSHRILSPIPRESCVRNGFASPSTRQNQEDYSPCGQYILPYSKQFCSELTLKITIINNCGNRPGSLQCAIKGHLPPHKYQQPLKRNTSK